MKYLTDFRKTVETGADPRLSTVIFQFSWRWPAIIYAVERVLFTVLESFVLRHLLKSYTSRVNKTL